MESMWIQQQLVTLPQKLPVGSSGLLSRTNLLLCRTQRFWLDQQPLALVAPTALAESNDDRIHRTLCLGVSGEQSITGWQKLQRAKARARKARGFWPFHHK